MSEYLTPADLDSLVDAIIAAEAGDRVAQYLLASDGAMSRLLAQARLAPDPDALPLSTAMRLARERTEAGAETWIQVPHAPKPFLLRHAPDANPYHGEWVCGDVLTGGHIAWGWVTFEADVIESAACKLVTPADGEAILRGAE